MAVVSSHTDFFQYAQEWLKKLDRGGLFPVNDETFLFFATIEKLVQSLLPSRLGRLKQDTTKGEVVQLVIDHTLVQQQLWAALSQDVDDDYILELLQEIVAKWVTMRGFSLAAAWIEAFKKKEKKTTRKKSSFRKELNKTLKEAEKKNNGHRLTNMYYFCFFLLGSGVASMISSSQGRLFCRQLPQTGFNATDF